MNAAPRLSTRKASCKAFEQARRKPRRCSRSQPASVTLRYLQTLTEIGSEQNSTIVFPLPIDVYRGLAAWADQYSDKWVRQDTGEKTQNP